MFRKKEPPRYQRMLEDELENVLTRLKIHHGDPEEYAKKLTIVERLHSMMPQEKVSSVSKDIWVSAGANLLGILIIIKHENVNVITSKALSFVARARI